MDKLLQSIIELVSNSPPDKAEQLARLIHQSAGADETSSLGDWAANPAARTRLTALLAAWKDTSLPSVELSGMLKGASAAYHRAKAEQEIELVWTGPSSRLVATRKTEQALLQVVNAAKSRLFITSFVAYDVASIMRALSASLDRSVEMAMLLEASEQHGGRVSIDAISKMKSALPTARILTWSKKEDTFSGGKVHAKVAVADYNFCFISSANLTGYAMEKNMEAGVLIRGGATPRQLQEHLEALETTNVIVRV